MSKKSNTEDLVLPITNRQCALIIEALVEDFEKASNKEKDNNFKRLLSVLSLFYEIKKIK